MRKESAIICDLDGTLALKHNDRTWYDASTCDRDLINEPVRMMCNLMAKNNYHLIFCSGRESKYREQTLTFLKKCFPDGIEDNDFSLFMRETGDFRKDSIVKHEIYYASIYNNWEIAFVLDDRTQVVQMWRNSVGLTCLQVADGNF